MHLLTNKPFHSSRLTFRPTRDSDAPLLSEYIRKDDGEMISWFGMDDLRENKMPNIEKAKKLIGIYKRNSNHKKQMLHVFKKHTQDIIGVANIWTDAQRNKRVALYLTPESRRKGLGAEAQILIFKEICRKDPKITMHVAQIEDPTNKASIKMFCSIGFKIAGMRRFALPISGNYDKAITLYRPTFK